MKSGILANLLVFIVLLELGSFCPIDFSPHYIEMCLHIKVVLFDRSVELDLRIESSFRVFRCKPAPVICTAWHNEGSMHWNIIGPKTIP